MEYQVEVHLRPMWETTSPGAYAWLAFHAGMPAQPPVGPVTVRVNTALRVTDAPVAVTVME